MPVYSDDEVEQYMVSHSAVGLNGTGGRSSDVPRVASDSRISVGSNQSLETFLEELECESRNSNFQELLSAHLSEMQHALVTRIDRVQMLVTRRLPGSRGAPPGAFSAVNGPTRTKGHVEAPTSPVDKTIVENLVYDSEGDAANAKRPSPPNALTKPSLTTAPSGGANSTASPSASLELAPVAAPTRPPPVFDLSSGASEASFEPGDAADREQVQALPSLKIGKTESEKKLSFSEDTLDVKKTKSKMSLDFSQTASKVSFKDLRENDSESGSFSSGGTRNTKGLQRVNSADTELGGKYTFELLPVWRRHGKKQLIGSLAFAAETRSMTRGNLSQTYESQGDDLVQQISTNDVATNGEKKRPCCKRYRCIAPNSPWRGVWDIMSCMLVFYDMVMIPLELLDPEDIPFAYGMSWVTRVFWTCDFPASLCTGYVRPDGVVERRPHKVAKRYLKTWFLFDILMISVEWLELIWSASNSMGFLRFGRTSRAFRIVRMVRLLRLIRIREVLVMIAERVRSERLIIAADVVKIMLVVVSFAHVMACIWFGIGNSDGSQDTWVRQFGIENATLGDRYSSSMHWSLSQFSGGMDEIRPANTDERVFTIFAFLFAFLMASTLVSRLTSSMTRLHMLSNTQAQQLVALRKYLSENGITQSVALRIQKNAQHAIAEQQRFMPEGKVELLQIVSEPLLMELHFELYHQVMNLHPFFGRYTEECAHVMRKVCHLAVVLIQVGLGDDIFNVGEIPLEPKMYFINSGMLMYEYFEAQMMVNQGQWIAEMTLWTSWMHRGTLSCTGNCRISVLDAAKFQDIVGRFEHPATFEPRLYAAHFVRELNETEGEITDLSIVSFPLSLLKRRASRMGDVEVQGNTLMKLFGFNSQKTPGATTERAPPKLARSWTAKENLGKVLPEQDAAKRTSTNTVNSA